MAKKTYEGCIYKHGRKYRYAYYIRGKPYNESFNTKEAAEIRAIELTLDKRKDRAVPMAFLKMDRLWELALANMRKNQRRSVGGVQVRVNAHLEPFFGQMKVSNFNPEIHITSYVNERRKKKVTNGTINRELQVLQRGFNLAFKGGEMDYQVFIEKLPEHNIRKESFSPGEFKTFCEHLPADVLAPVLFDKECGWRLPSEILPLTWSQIDFDEELVWLEPYSTKDQSPEPREFFFTARMKALLKKQRLAVDALQRKFSKIIPLVFPNSEGAPLFYRIVDREGNAFYQPNSYFRKEWKRACDESGIIKVTHDLRRTSALEKDAAGLSITDIMNAGGWRTSQMPQRYLQKSREDKKAAAKKIDEYRRKTGEHLQNHTNEIVND